MKALIIIICVIIGIIMMTFMWCSLIINKYEIKEEFQEKSIDKKSKK